MVTAGIVGNDILVEFESWARVCSGETELLGFLMFKAVCKARLVEIVLIVSTIMTDKHTYNNLADPIHPTKKNNPEIRPFLFSIANDRHSSLARKFRARGVSIMIMRHA